MSGIIAHSPSDVVAHVLWGLELGTDPEANGAWPAGVGGEPDSPDNCITVYDTTGRSLGREGPTGRRTEYYGIQARVRAAAHTVGWAKANAIAVALDRASYVRVTIDGIGYRMETFIRTGPVISFGEARTQSPRRVFVINGLAVIGAT
jgi:hypothetical protein